MDPLLWDAHLPALLHFWNSYLLREVNKLKYLIRL